ncbi:MAG: FxLYD domain-containing protein, partial [Peptostreptococcaceae bacterium]
DKIILQDAVKKELDILSKYKDAKFDNPELKKLAQDYILALETQQDALKYYDSDYGKYERLWKDGYDSRSTILVTLVEKFGLELSEKQFDDLKTNAQVVKENQEFQSKIDTILKGIKFEIVKDEYGWKDYEAVVENTSGVDLEGFYLNIDLIDKDGIVVDTTMASHNGIWKNGQKYKFTFSTDKTFEKMEWTAEYYTVQ